MIQVRPEGLVGELMLRRAGIDEGLGSGRYVGLGRDGLLGMFGPGKRQVTWDQGRGKWPVIQDRPEWPQKLERV